MRAVVQRVKSSSVSVDGKIISEIEKGLMVFLGVEEDDDEKDLEYILKKVISVFLTFVLLMIIYLKLSFFTLILVVGIRQ